MKHRNFKVIFKNIALKQNVIYLSAYDFNEAYSRVRPILLKLGYVCVTTSRGKGSNVYHFAPSDNESFYSRRYRNQHASRTVLLEIVNLHQNRITK